MSAPNTPFVVILNKTDVTVQSIPKYHKLQLHVQSYGVFFLEFSGCSGSTYLNDVQVIPLAPQTDCVQAGIFYDFSVDDPLPYQYSPYGILSPWSFVYGGYALNNDTKGLHVANSPSGKLIYPRFILKSKIPRQFGKKIQLCIQEVFAISYMIFYFDEISTKFR